jgi:hypothetical protein
MPPVARTGYRRLAARSYATQNGNPTGLLLALTAFGPRYDTSHVFVAPDDVDRLVTIRSESTVHATGFAPSQVHLGGNRYEAPTSRW